MTSVRRSPGRARCRRPHGRRRATAPARAGPRRSPAGGRGSTAGSRGTRGSRWTPREDREQRDRLGGQPAQHRQRERARRSRPAPGSIRSGWCRPRVPSTTGEVCRALVGAGHVRRRTRRRRPCAGSAGGSGSVTRMKPRRGRIGSSTPASAATSAGPGAGGVDHAPARDRSRAVVRHRGDPPAVRATKPVTAHAGAHASPRAPRAGAEQVGGGEHRLHLRVLRVEHAAGEVRRRGAARTPCRSAPAATSTPRPRPPAAGAPAPRRASAPAAVAATTSPPLASNSTAARPMSARSSAARAAASSSARSSSGPGSLSETSRLPSPALVVPPAICAPFDARAPRTRPGRRSRRRPRRPRPRR